MFFVGPRADAARVARRHSGASEDAKQARRFLEMSNWLTTNVRSLRRRARLTQEQLAERAGVATTYVARIEAATQPVNVTLRLLAALSTSLSCHPHELITPAEPPRRLPAGRPLAAPSLARPAAGRTPRPRRG
jgi:DNA-binding Xre family transcriptional regulator